jgi:hypothetical protein
MLHTNDSTIISTPLRREVVGCAVFWNPFRGSSSAALALLLSAVLLCFGCASPDVNPAVPKAKTGYLDFYAHPDDDLSWQVEQFDSAKNRFKVIYSNVEYLDGSILRLAAKPGSYRLRVSFLNRVVTTAGECEVTVLDGRITPVQANLTQTGTSLLLSRDTSAGGTVYGRFGRRTKLEASEALSVTISLSTLDPRPYELKAHMPYAH